MVDQPETYFEETYDKYYNRVIKYVVSKCSDISNVQDIVQEVFIEYYSLINHKGVSYIRNTEAMLIRISKIKLYKNYTLLQRLRDRVSLARNDEHYDYIEDSALEDRDINERVNNTLIIEEIWQIIRNKDRLVQKVFYLYYYCDMTIKEISEEMKISESNVKHKIYRTLEEIRNKYKGR